MSGIPEIDSQISGALLDDCVKRDRRAQYGMYKLLFSFLLGVCMRYARNREDAEELLNIGFLKILNNLEKYNRGNPFSFWARRVMINAVLDELKKNKRYRELSVQVDFSEHHSHFDSAETGSVIRNMNYEYILEQIRKLPPVSRQVFNLFVVDGFSHKEIASQLEISDGTSKWHLNFARTKLRELLKEEEYSIPKEKAS